MGHSLSQIQETLRRGWGGVLWDAVLWVRQAAAHRNSQQLWLPTQNL